LRCYSDSDGIKADLARKLVKFELPRKIMIKCLDMAFDLSIEQLENIAKNLSKNQLRSKFGQALLFIIEYKNYL